MATRTSIFESNIPSRHPPLFIYPGRSTAPPPQGLPPSGVMTFWETVVPLHHSLPHCLPTGSLSLLLRDHCLSLPHCLSAAPPPQGLPPSGVMTFWETAVPLAARVAEALGCSGNTSKAIDAAKNKFMTRKLMLEAGLPSPKNFLLQDASQLEEAAQHVGFPVRAPAPALGRTVVCARTGFHLARQGCSGSLVVVPTWALPVPVSEAYKDLYRG